MTRRDELSSYISDAHKDAHGFRPRHIDFVNTPIADLERIADRLTDEVCETIRADELREKKANEEFETLIETVIRYGAGDRATAIRWIADSINDIDAGYICYTHGISYSYEAEISACI